MEFDAIVLSKLISNGGYLDKYSAKLVGNLIVISHLSQPKDLKINTVDYINHRIKMGEQFKSNQNGELQVLVNDKWVDLEFILPPNQADNLGIIEFCKETEKHNQKICTYAINNPRRLTGGVWWERD